MPTRAAPSSQPSSPDAPAAERWNPWSALRDRPHVEFRLDAVAAILGGGFYARQGGRAAIVLDPALHRRRRRTALAHELIHDERGAGFDAPGMPATWDAVVAREEAAVDAEVARRMVPVAELEAFVRPRLELGLAVDAWEVADEFDVDQATAVAAMRSTLAAGLLGRTVVGDTSPMAARRRGRATP